MAPYRNRLSSLMLLDESATEAWSPNDLRAMLDHQFAAPLVLDLGYSGGSPDEPDASGIRSFGELFSCDHPPLALLELTKRFAKRCMDDPTGAVPREVALVLYYLSIATAQRRLRCSISALSFEQLATGIDWCLEQPWIGGQAAELLADSMQL